MNNGKARPMSKDETAYLVDLVDSHKVITCKTTNATYNRLKEEAWAAIAEEFNAGSKVYRTAAQLRFKWDNLKKSARKRAADIRKDRLKTGGGPGKHYLGDDILEKVTTIMGTSSLGLPIDLGGDAEVLQFPIDLGGDAEVLQEFTISESQDSSEPDCGADVNVGTTSFVLHPDELSHQIPSSPNAAHLRRSGTRLKKPSVVTKLYVEELRSRVRRNNAMAEYYKLKKLKLGNVEHQNMLIQNLQLQLENKKMENEILRNKNKSK